MAPPPPPPAPSSPRPRRLGPRAVAGIVLTVAALCLLPVVVPIVFPPTGRSAETSNRVRCASNLKVIGTAILAYARDNGGHYPPDLAVLYTHAQTSDEYLSPETFVCPSSDDTPAPGATPAVQAANLLAAGHCSYVYLGANLTAPVDPERIIAHERPDAHDGDGITFLFGDNYVDFIIKQPARRLLDHLRAGHNPPPKPSA